jgi:acetyltransferase-like isoleucine patch superfamily enzyme
MTRVELFFKLVTAPSRIVNKLLNLAFSAMYGAHIRIVWSDIKIIGASGIQFGQRFTAGRGLWLETIGPEARLDIGDNVNVSDWVHIGAINHVQIGDGCLLGSKVVITDHSHGQVSDIASRQFSVRPDLRKLYSKGPVILEANVWLGDNVVVLPGITIGANAIVGANAVVTSNIPSNTVWAGVPAIQIWPT